MGKLKGKIVKSGDSGCLKIKQPDGSWTQYDYQQPFSAQLGIVENATISCVLVTRADKTVVATSVVPVDKGTIVEINYDNNTGSILETESGIKYPFSHPMLKEQGFQLNDVVKYTLVCVKDVMQATALVNPNA
ncbi:MAG: hypothetical protein JST26_07420 [Bacteroidetes bacterium]|nr:hypothetical protein [Bacteroidota bacterium]